LLFRIAFRSPSSYDPVAKEKKNRDKYHAYKDQLEALLIGPTIALKNYFTRFSGYHMVKGYDRFNQAFDDVSDEQASSAIQTMINELDIFTDKTLYYHLMDEYTWFQDTFGVAYQQAQEVFDFTKRIQKQAHDIHFKFWIQVKQQRLLIEQLERFLLADDQKHLLVQEAKIEQAVKLEKAAIKIIHDGFDAIHFHNLDYAVETIVNSRVESIYEELEKN
jgi:hypothetical protein